MVQWYRCTFFVSSKVLVILEYCSIITCYCQLPYLFLYCIGRQALFFVIFIICSVYLLIFAIIFGFIWKIMICIYLHYLPSSFSWISVLFIIWPIISITLHYIPYLWRIWEKVRASRPPSGESGLLAGDQEFYYYLPLSTFYLFPYLFGVFNILLFSQCNLSLLSFWRY